MRSPVFHRMFKYNRALLPNAHLASLEAGIVGIEAARAKTGATIGYPGWGLIYHLLLCHLDRNRDEIIIETGTNQGCTTIILAQALVDADCKGHVFSFELDPENIAIAQSNHIAAGVSDRITIVSGSVHDTFRTCLYGKSGIRFAFLDASHLLNDVMFEFEALLPHFLSLTR